MLGRKKITIIVVSALIFNVLSPISVLASEINYDLEEKQDKILKSNQDINEYIKDNKENSILINQDTNVEFLENYVKKMEDFSMQMDDDKEEEISDFSEVINKEKLFNQELPANYNDYDSLEKSTLRMEFLKKNEIKDVKIISGTPITVDQAKAWAKSKGATETFISLADLFWKYSLNNGAVNPAIAYVQSAKETGYGKFGGVLDETYFNTCGLKTAQGGGDYDAEAHQRFESWDQGVQAHLDHLALYAGAQGYPRSNTYDPRHFPSIAGKATTVYQLSGNWAPSNSYGTAVAGLYADMMKYSGNADTSEDTTDSADIGWSLINGKWYYLDGSGNKKVDWIKKNGKWYYLDENGIMQADGWHIIKESYYYLYKDGSMATGVINDGYADYYLDPVIGNLKSGWQIINNQYYYFDTNGGAMKKGWYHDGYDWYFLDKNSGIMQKGKINDGHADYYLDTITGALKLGWQIINNQYYYFDPNGGSMKKGWYYDGYDWYFLDKNSGIMQKGKINDGYADYYLDVQSGAMKKGWYYNNREYYHLNNETGVMDKGWYYDGQDWYYTDPSTGVMKTGLIDIGGEKYYMLPGGNMGVKWHVINGVWRYFYSNGVMAKNITIDNCYINANGIYKGKKIIFIDAGHSKTGDRGSSKTYNGKVYYEGDLNLEVSIKLKNELIKRGYDVKMSRDSNDYNNISLAERVDKANSSLSDLFVSIHHDSGIETARGVTSFYSSYKPKLDQQDIVKKNGWGGLINVDETPSPEAIKGKRISDILVKKLSSENSFNNRNSHDRNLYVTRETIMPALLVECGFLSNEQELKRISDPKVQEQTAKIIADSIDAEYN